MTKWRKRPKPCHCGGYWFPHRKGSGACEHNGADAIRHIAKRLGLSPTETQEFFIDYALENPGKVSTTCPF
jgi:hypothetical protein